MRPSALADAECRNELRVGIERDKGPHVADARTVVLRSHLALLLLYIRPNLIDLNAAASQVAHLLVHDRGAAISDLHQQPHDRVAVRVGHALCRADGIALNQSVDDLCAAANGQAVHFKSP